MDQFIISRKDSPNVSETVDASQLIDACERMSEQGRYELSIVKQEPAPKLFGVVSPSYKPTDMTADDLIAASAPKLNSTFEAGGLVVDEQAKARIEAQQSALIAAGVAVDSREQFFGTGTRMADVGYAEQSKRKAEHDRKLPLRDAADALAESVRAERREDIVLSAADLAKGIHANGKITFDGLAIGEQAIRGLTSRLDAPILGYVLGLRDRISRTVNEAKKAEAAGLVQVAANLREQARSDRAEIASVVVYECKRNPDVALKLRAAPRGG